MQIIRLNQTHGEAYPTNPIYIASDDISCVFPFNGGKNTLICFKGHPDAQVQVAEELEYVVAKWREAIRER